MSVKKTNILKAFRFAGAAAAALLLLFFCLHTEYYQDEEGMGTLFTSPRTYVTAASSLILMVFILLPNTLSERRNKIMGWVWAAAAPFAVYFSLLHLNADKYDIHFLELNKIALVLTFCFLFLAEMIFLLITGSIKVSVILLAVPVAVLGIANCFVTSFRGMAISAADLFSMGSAMSVASEYTYEIDWYMFSEIFWTFAICAVSLKIRGFRLMKFPLRIVLLAAWGVGAGSFFFLCCRTTFLEDYDIRSQGFSHQLRYKEYDMLFTTLCTCFYLAAEKPGEYSLDKVAEIGEPYTEQVQEAADTPHLIVIMNESLADYGEIGKGLELSEDNMPFMHSLEENTIKGTVYSSVFGANTPNSEYEFLTGNTMAFLPESSVGFHLFVRGDMPSLASELKQSGYETLAMHPYRGYNYRRHLVYPQIGFDTYYTRNDFEDPEYIRSYISDQSLAERIVQEYEKNLDTGNPLFSYNVSIQNHGGYSVSNLTNLSMDIQVETEGIKGSTAQIYVNLVRKTDEMFQWLVEYFSQEEEPVAILMFGDHQPNLGESTYNYLIGEEESCTSEELMEKYKVPFILWTNYDIQEDTIEKTSLNYLYSQIAEKLNFPMTGYQSYLLDLSKEIPVINTVGYWGDDGNFYELDDETSPYYERVQEYNILEYNYIFGGNDRYLELFKLPG